MAALPTAAVDQAPTESPTFMRSIPPSTTASNGLADAPAPAADSRSRIVALFQDRGWWLALLVPAAVALWLRPLIPPVETRYINVAWEMWSQGHFLVPVLNTASYSDKPPLFFWLIHLGWAIFGVNEWWPRAIPVIFAGLNTSLAGYLASRLWPGNRQTRNYAVWMLAGTLAWMVFGVALMFDMLLSTCVLLGLIALVQAGTTGQRRWHALYAAAIALGILAKGPVIFLHLLPVAVLAPWWLGPDSGSRPLVPPHSGRRTRRHPACGAVGRARGNVRRRCVPAKNPVEANCRTGDGELRPRPALVVLHLYLPRACAALVRLAARLVGHAQPRAYG